MEKEKRFYVPPTIEAIELEESKDLLQSSGQVDSEDFEEEEFDWDSNYFEIGGNS